MIHPTNTVWFSRHEPSAAQIAELAESRTTLVAVAEGMALGAMSINTEEDYLLIVSQLKMLVSKHKADSVTGVFTTDFLEDSINYLHNCVARGDFFPGSFSLVGTKNAMRPVEGGRPAYEHRGFGTVGILSKHLSDEERATCLSFAQRMESVDMWNTAMQMA